MIKYRIVTLRHLALIPCLLIASFNASSAPFTPGNILVTHDKHLLEYTLDGVQIQSLSVPHPDTDRYDVTDAVVDQFGRAHVLNTAPFSNSYISTFDPVTNAWDHNEVSAGLGNLSDGDLSISGDTLFTKNQAVSVIDYSIRDILVPGLGVGEISVGLDNVLYALDSGSPRAGVRLLDPNSFTLISQLSLLNELGYRLNARGIAVNADGTIFALDFDGYIYQFDSAGQLLNSISLPISRTTDLDLDTNGVLIAAGNGEVAITNARLDSVSSFSVGTNFNYVGFVPVAGARPDNDNDGILNFIDNCPETANPEQLDTDSDSLGDICDPYPGEADNLGMCLFEKSNAGIEINVLNDEILNLNSLNSSLATENSTLQAEINRLQNLTDTDVDSVPDVIDECPATLPRTRVNDRGCSRKQRRALSN